MKVVEVRGTSTRYFNGDAASYYDIAIYGVCCFHILREIFKPTIYPIPMFFFEEYPF